MAPPPLPNRAMKKSWGSFKNIFKNCNCIRPINDESTISPQIVEYKIKFKETRVAARVIEAEYMVYDTILRRFSKQDFVTDHTEVRGRLSCMDLEAIPPRDEDLSVLQRAPERIGGVSKSLSLKIFWFGDDQIITVWDAQKGCKLYAIEGLPAPVYSVPQSILFWVLTYVDEEIKARLFDSFRSAIDATRLFCWTASRLAQPRLLECPKPEGATVTDNNGIAIGTELDAHIQNTDGPICEVANVRTEFDALRAVLASQFAEKDKEIAELNAKINQSEMLATLLFSHLETVEMRLKDLEDKLSLPYITSQPEEDSDGSSIEEGSSGVTQTGGSLTPEISSKYCRPDKKDIGTFIIQDPDKSDVEEINLNLDEDLESSTQNQQPDCVKQARLTAKIDHPLLPLEGSSKYKGDCSKIETSEEISQTEKDNYDSSLIEIAELVPLSPTGLDAPIAELVPLSPTGPDASIAELVLLSPTGPHSPTGSDEAIEELVPEASTRHAAPNKQVLIVSLQQCVGGSTVQIEQIKNELDEGWTVQIKSGQVSVVVLKEMPPSKVATIHSNSEIPRTRPVEQQVQKVLENDGSSAKIHSELETVRTEMVDQLIPKDEDITRLLGTQALVLVSHFKAPESDILDTEAEIKTLTHELHSVNLVYECSNSASRDEEGSEGGTSQVANKLHTDLEALSTELTGQKESIVLYTTTVGVVRETSENCKRVRALLENLNIDFYEKDISLGLGYKEELHEMLGSDATLPCLFVNGTFVGGAEEVQRLNEYGTLQSQLWQRCKGSCTWCGGIGFGICTSCDGTHRLVYGQGRAVTTVPCPECNEHGLVRCSYCN